MEVVEDVGPILQPFLVPSLCALINSRSKANIKRARAFSLFCLD